MTSSPTTIALISSQITMNHLVPAFQAQFPDARLRVGDDLGPLDEIDAAVCWYPEPGLLRRMPRLRLIQSLAAGVDHITCDTDLPAVPLCRIVDPDMASGMAAYVAWAVVHQQRHMGAYLASAAQARWEEQAIVAPSRHRVGIAGLGTLGLNCARTLLSMGYPVRGWSRTAKADLPAGIDAFHGEDQCNDFLSGCDTLVCLLPLTPETQGFLCAERFAQMPRGAHLVNVGRGAHLVDADLLRALDDGTLGAATLDAFTHEPLPESHPFWRHPRITVTPHIATRTAPAVIARQTHHNLAQILAGRADTVAIDLTRGY